MNTKDLIRLGEPIRLAHEFIQNFIAQGNDGALLEGEIFNIVANPPAFFADELRAPLARAIYRPAFTPRAELPLRRLRSDRSADGREALPRSAFAPWRQWGEGLESRGGEADGQCVCAAGRSGGRAHAGCARGLWLADRRRARDGQRGDCRSGGYAVTAPRMEGRRCRAVRSRRGASGARAWKPRR